MNNFDLDEREIKLLSMCINYNNDPFGAPNHSLMVLVAKLWNFINKPHKDEGLNGYEVCIFTSVYHNDEYSHTLQRYEKVHTTTVDEAMKLVELKDYEQNAFYNMKITTKEWIHDVKYLGKVTYKSIVEYV